MKKLAIVVAGLLGWTMLTAQTGCVPANEWFGGARGPAIACVLLDGYVRPKSATTVQCSFANRAFNPTRAERDSCYSTIMLSPYPEHTNYAMHCYTMQAGTSWVPV